MKYILYILSTIGILYLAFHIFERLQFFCNNSEGTEYYQIYGVLGDYVGGVIGTVISLLTLILVYLTFANQRKELRIQKDLISTQQFESTFFNLLNVHRELKNSLALEERFSITAMLTKLDRGLFINRDYVPTYEKLSGTNVFLIINDDMTIIYDINDYKDKLKRLNKLLEISGQKEQLLKKLEKHIVDYHSNSINLSGIKNDNNIEDKDGILLEYEKNRIKDLFKIIFSVYKNQISHYCRNVYHILKFIRMNEANEKNSKDKYKQYANLFLSQLNVSEQVLLFYNFFYFDNHEKGIFSTINLVKHYSFLENIGTENLLNSPIHQKFYNIEYR